MENNDYIGENNPKKDIKDLQIFANKFKLLTKEEEYTLTCEYYLLRANQLQRFLDFFTYKKHLKACPFLLYNLVILEEKAFLFEYIVQSYYKVRRDQLLDELCNRNLRLVLNICQKPTYQDRGLPVFDLFMEGYDGLRYGLSRKFNPFLGFKVSTYCTRWIHQRISRAIANKGSMVKVAGNIQDQISKIRVVVREFCKTSNGDKPSAETICELLKAKYPKMADITPERVAELGRLSWQHVSLDELTSSNEEVSNLTIKDHLAADESYDPELIYEQIEKKAKVKEFLKLLDKDEQIIITYMMGLLDYVERTPKQIARLMGISVNDVKKKYEIAMTKMKSMKDQIYTEF